MGFALVSMRLCEKVFFKKKSHSLILCCKYRLKGLLHLLRIENSTLSTINCKQ